MNNYYGKDYFDWQKEIGEFGGRANLFKFQKYIKSSDTVVDFGCGGGYLLKNLQCSQKIGIEPNKEARKIAGKNGIKTISSADELTENSIDVIISNHALEHVHNPFFELSKLHEKLKPGGKIIFVVPNEKKKKYLSNDINNHLYTWTEMNLGNLFTAVGFNVIEVNEIKHRWPPKYFRINEIFGERIFNLASKLYAIIFNNISQIRIVAEKK